MSGLKNYRELDAWRLAMSLVEIIYRLTRELPDSERYGLVSQMHRSAVSVPSNIAEGQARATTRFGLHYIRIALGCSAELDTQIEVARRLHYLTGEQTREVDSLLARVQQTLYGMRREHLRRLGIDGVKVTSVALLILAAVRFLA